MQKSRPSFERQLPLILFYGAPGAPPVVTIQSSRLSMAPRSITWLLGKI